MSNDRLTSLAMQLLVLGVSKSGVERLLSDHELDEVERQLAYLPYRHAKRPEAFVVEAVRNRYSPPKEFFYAETQAESADPSAPVDQDAEPLDGSVDAGPQGH